MPGRNKRKERSWPEPQTQAPLENLSSSCSSLSADNLSPPSTIAYILPPGFKFVPSDEQIIFCYLKPYLDGNKNVLLDVPIHLVNIYESNPQQLSVEFDKGNDKEWFIITERNKVDQGLSQTKRVGNGGIRQKRGDTKGGYWHATVGAQEINVGDIVGYKTAFAYYVREQSADVKTDWLMLEYSLHHTCHNNDKDYTLCKIYLTPQATKMKKKEVEEKKKGQGVISVGERSSPEPQKQPTSENPSSSLSADNLSPLSTIPYLLPPSYKFVPADEEVIFCYLKPYLDGNKNVLLNVPIHLVNIYESNPQLLSVEFDKGNDKEWFIITERKKVDQGLSQTKRVGNGGTTRQKRSDTKGGYWHATAGAQEIDAGGIVGYKTALAYYVREQSADFKTDWLMLEYSLHHTCHNNDKDYTLCKIYLTPQATKKKKEVEAQNKKQKKGEGVISVASVEALEEQQPRNVEYPQPHQSQALLDSYQHQPHDIAFQQPQFSQGLIDSQQPLPPLRLLDSLEGLVSFEIEYQQEQQSHMMMMQDSRSGMAMTGWRNDESAQEDLLDMSKDDMFFSMDELFNNVEEHGTVVTQQQQQQQQEHHLSTLILASGLGQDSGSRMVTSNDNNSQEDYWLDICNGVYIDIDALLNDLKT
ncbi:unnamed protein product [Arabidopsis arenosa]|uniref:NAC domain-containing protein n=1 Tax=Arabidopsis arenosa TaxID=38785 RepID=A0A8S2ADH9_ARAAE|nr:unnamed protein product [Arabidopsis arenosa]